MLCLMFDTVPNLYFHQTVVEEAVQLLFDEILVEFSVKIKEVCFFVVCVEPCN